MTIKSRKTIKIMKSGRVSRHVIDLLMIATSNLQSKNENIYNFTIETERP